MDEAQAKEDSDTASETEETVMKLSIQAVSGTSCKESIKLQGMIGKTHLLILIDSGSSNNFISEKLVEKLQCPVEQLNPATVRVAGGGLLTCTKQVLGLQWWCQGTSFTTSLKALPLDNYDIILGMQWLETMSPM